MHKSNYDYDTEEFTKSNNKIVSVNMEGGVPTLTFARKLVNLNSYQTVGQLLIDIKLNELTKIINDTQLKETSFIWMVNADGKIIYHPDKNNMGKTISIKELKNFKNQSHGTYIKEDNANDETLVTFNHSDVTDIITVAEVSKNELMHDLFNLRNITIIFVVFNIGISLFIIGGFSLYIINSLGYLQSKMNQVELGNLSIRTNECNNDE